MLDFINYPVSAILLFWHAVFGALLEPDSGYAWALSVVFLVFTLRALLFKPFVHQVRSMRKMQEVAPHIQRLQREYSDDPQRLTAEMRKLQSEQGFNPLGGCLPVLVQVPVFIGLFRVLNGFQPGETSNYFFGEEGVRSFLDAHLFGASLSGTISAPAEELASFGTDRSSMLLVGVPLMLVAAVATHFTTRHSIARQRGERNASVGSPNQQAMMNRIMLWLLPMFAVIAGPFLPLAILLYWLANNFWTLGQQRIVFRRIDLEEAQRQQTREAAPAVVDSSTAEREDFPGRPKDDEQAESPGIPEDRSSEADRPDEHR
ncbi:membrane protein insertase YidC [Actinopolyspora erythraea]|uniref:Membrane protein insertase YidC n=1 Tax=Actinopolyspora erythraea TaxID=414996 RepID=A0A099D9V6_9ACTN|nr:membrane protein insertase YidC [Actinopolyspora erythraea]ASU80679.1 membrane protein insertase YidC [Actinopolyspora erythraea]KGI82953.1 preprotein translocase subunit YidC [Actinopolyspora erythraea]